MRRDYTVAGTEPPLAELLDDPLVQLVMRRDRLELADLWRVIDVARQRLAAAGAGAFRAQSGPADSPAEPAIASGLGES